MKLHMKSQKRQRFRQIAMIVFLVLIVLGFTIPGFLNPPDSVVQAAEPRLCQTDADCYLFCDETPKEVLCSQNLCQQNSCEEASYYAFKETPLQLSLVVELENETLSLQNRSSSRNVFVTFNDPTVSLFSSGLTLQHVLEKAGMQLTAQCLVVDAVRYCEDEDTALQVMVNGNQTFSYGNYAPKEGDAVKISFMKKEDQKE